jgi:PadR family transcriptional regulator PadR
MFDKINIDKEVEVFFLIHSDILRGHLDTIILKLIIEKDRYGYEIANCIKKRTKDAFMIKEATLYSVVNRLENKGLIESYHGEQSHGKKRRYYRITSLGSAYFKQKTDEWREFKDILDTLLEEYHETN